MEPRSPKLQADSLPAEPRGKPVFWILSPYWIYPLQIFSPIQGFPCGSAGKESACNLGDLGSIPGLGRAPGQGKGYPLWYSGLENSMDCIVTLIFWPGEFHGLYSP